MCEEVGWLGQGSAPTASFTQTEMQCLPALCRGQRVDRFAIGLPVAQKQHAQLVHAMHAPSVHAEVFQSALSAGVTNVSFSQLSGNLGRTMYQASGGCGTACLQARTCVLSVLALSAAIWPGGLGPGFEGTTLLHWSGRLA